MSAKSNIFRSIVVAVTLVICGVTSTTMVQSHRLMEQETLYEAADHDAFGAFNGLTKSMNRDVRSRQLHVGPHAPVPPPVLPPTTPTSPPTLMESVEPSLIPSYIPTSIDVTQGMEMSKYPSTAPSSTVLSLKPTLLPSLEINSSHPPSEVPSGLPSFVPSFFAASISSGEGGKGSNGKGNKYSENDASIEPDADENVEGKGRRMMMLLMLNGAL